MEDLSKFCCQNKDCPDYGKYGLNNLTVCGWFGKNKHIRLLYCRTCKYRFSERKGTPLFGLRLDKQKMATVFNHISEGCGVRKTSRLVGVHRDTVSRYASAAGKKAKILYQELANDTSRAKEIRVKKDLLFAGKKESPDYENNLPETQQEDNLSSIVTDQIPELPDRPIALEHRRVTSSQGSNESEENEDLVSGTKKIVG